jgi:hypothetical protein
VKDYECDCDRYNPGQTYADFIFLTGVNGFVTGILSPFFGALARQANKKHIKQIGGKE